MYIMTNLAILVGGYKFNWLRWKQSMLLTVLRRYVFIEILCGCVHPRLNCNQSTCHGGGVKVGIEVYGWGKWSQNMQGLKWTKLDKFLDFGVAQEVTIINSQLSTRNFAWDQSSGMGRILPILMVIEQYFADEKGPKLLGETNTNISFKPRIFFATFALIWYLR